MAASTEHANGRLIPMADPTTTTRCPATTLCQVTLAAAKYAHEKGWDAKLAKGLAVGLLAGGKALVKEATKSTPAAAPPQHHSGAGGAQPEPKPKPRPRPRPRPRPKPRPRLRPRPRPLFTTIDNYLQLISCDFKAPKVHT